MANIIYPPGPTSIIPGRFIWELRQSPTDFLYRQAQEYGDMVHFNIGKRHFYLLNHPDYIQEMLVKQNGSFHKGQALKNARHLLGNGLLTSEGDFHLRQRRMMQPAFHRRQMAHYGEIMLTHTARMLADWQPDDELDIHHTFSGLLLEIVAKCLFDADLSNDSDGIGEALNVMVSNFGRLINPLGALINALPLPSSRQIREAVAHLDRVVYRLIDERLRDGYRDDLLSVLLQSEMPMTKKQIRDEVLTLLLAGHETTANALSWTFYLLAKHPEVSAELTIELTRTLHNQPPTVASVADLPYTRRVFSEALRLYPPAWAIGREAIESCQIGGYTIPAGATLLASQWVMHHDPRYYPAPFAFDPDRWTADKVSQRPKFSYFPFGGGARFCIGERFAWMEAILIMASIHQKWQLKLAPGEKPIPKAAITLRPKHGIKMIAVPQKTTMNEFIA